MYFSLERKLHFIEGEKRICCPFFTKENNLVFCNDIGNLLKKTGLSEYTRNPSEWHLFIDSSKRSLKCVHFNNGNKYGPIPIGHCTTMKEACKAISLVLEKINYQEHQWVNCVDLKMVNFLLGQQSGYTNILAFYAFGRVEPNTSTGQEKIGLRGNIWWLEDKCNQ